jgi:hypothetical protein
MIVVQKDKFSPLEHYNTLGYIIVCITVLSVYLLSRVSSLVKRKTAENHNAQPVVAHEPELIIE